jgi:hypothetical protein
MQAMLRKWAYATLVALGTGVWLTVPLHAQDETPPWQRPPMSDAFAAGASQPGLPGGVGSSENVYSERGDACGSCGPCGECDDIGCRLGGLIFGPLWGCLRPHDDWVRVEALLWWTNGGKTPPLLTTSPDGTSQSQAGVLGQPGTTVLLGNQELNNGFRAGGRISFGTWLDACDDTGIEFNYLGLGQSSNQYTATSNGSPILARPFFDVDTGAENALLIAYPNVYNGSFSCSSTSDFQAAELLVRRALARAPGYRIELLAGYRFQQLTEKLDITDTATTGAITAQTLDQFHTQNNFNGGELGIATEWHQCRWSFETNLKVALGDTHSSIDIEGSTTTGGTTSAGGLLALASNSGVHDADQFSVIPEIGATLGYDLTCHLRATLGYTLIYWSGVSRPGDQIDLDVSPSQFPGPDQTTATKPAFTQHTSDFWAQGVNVGLDYRF